MKKNLNFKTLFILTILVFAFSSCKKKDEGDGETKITVTVKLDGDPVDGARVDIGESYHYIKTQTTNSQGKTVFHNLDPGNYDFEAWYDSQGNTYFVDGGPVDLKSGQSLKVTLNLRLLNND